MPSVESATKDMDLHSEIVRKTAYIASNLGYSVPSVSRSKRRKCDVMILNERNGKSVIVEVEAGHQRTNYRKLARRLKEAGYLIVITDRRNRIMKRFEKEIAEGRIYVLDPKTYEYVTPALLVKLLD
ncbi:MAG: hypothetical protein DRZ82_03810 [Thermoprotei archaeon]|nr:MAG: hypothetical protein DRZ82_03810 [Thermoprotei archaeon]